MNTEEEIRQEIHTLYKDILPLHLVESCVTWWLEKVEKIKAEAYENGLETAAKLAEESWLTSFDSINQKQHAEGIASAIRSRIKK